MPSESQVLRCGNCGANLSPVPGQNIVQCAYCGQSTYLSATVVTAPQVELASAAAHPARATGVHERLLRGPDVEPRRGRAVRLTTRDMPYEALVPAERAIWPSRASASTTYGGSWSPSAMVGPPKVFPRYGDIGGAWAPSSSSSPVEWVELEYSSEHPVSALRVYETNKSGCVYAVVDHTGTDELLYAGPVEPRSDACALEITLDAPRVIRRLRVYLTNRSGYVEIDTVALLARDPLPLEQRPPIPPPTRELSVDGVMWLVGAVVALIAIAVVYFVGRAAAPSDSSDLAATTYPLLPGVTLTPSGPPLESILARSPQWASEVVDFSSEYSSAANSAAQILGPPDVYPRAGDIPQAWAPLPADGGLQHITVRFPAGAPVRSVLWLATLGPGAVVRVDDLGDPAHPVTLFAGDDPSGGMGSAALELTLPAPRTITTLRLYLDTDRQVGWSELDAIALIP